MKLQTYCDNMSKELVNWQDRINSVVAQFDDTSCGEKAKVLPQINDLRMIREELQTRIETLRRECPTNWEAEKTQMEKDAEKLQEKFEEVCYYIPTMTYSCGCCC